MSSEEYETSTSSGGAGLSQNPEEHRRLSLIQQTERNAEVHTENRSGFGSEAATTTETSYRRRPSQRARSIPTESTRVHEEEDQEAAPEVSRGRKMSKTVQPRQSRSCDAFGAMPKREPEITRHMLYKEALYTAVHMLGRPSKRFPASHKDMLTYAQIAFATDPKEQVAFSELVCGEPYPIVIVNVGIRKAEGLAARDKTGFSDPYCLTSVETEDSMSVDDARLWKKLNSGSPTHPKKILPSQAGEERPVAEKRFDQLYATLPTSIRTTIENQTLNPIWEQRFQCLVLRPAYDILHVEVWDHDDDQQVVDSIRAATDFKHVTEVEVGKELQRKGVGKKDDFIGKAMIKIPEIPVEGQEKWHHLRGMTHRGTEARGRLLVQVWLTHAYRHGRHDGEYASPTVVLEALWDTILEIERDRSARGSDWDGEIPVAATCLLFQYGLQNGMSEATQAVICWNARVKLHLSVHGTEVGLRRLDDCLESFDKLSGLSPVERLKDSNQREMERSVHDSLKDPFRVIRNHFHEPQTAVEEALKTIRYSRGIFSRLQNFGEVGVVDFELQASLRMAVLEWYQAKFLDTVKLYPGIQKHEIISLVAVVVREVIVQLERGAKVWGPVFFMEGAVEYMPIVYDEFQKMVVHDVELLTCSAIQPYWRNNDYMRRILLNMNEAEKAACRALFELYSETKVFVAAQDDIFKQRLSNYDNLNDYHDWFRPVLVLWLGFTFIRAVDLIQRCIHIDKVMKEDVYVMTSSSAVDTAVVFNSLAAFLRELGWPDMAESYVVTHFVLEIMVYITILYARMKRAKIDKEGYFDTVDRFDISERLCTAVNNIQFVQETLMNVPKELKFDTSLEKLEKDLAAAPAFFSEKKSRVTETLTFAVVEVEKELQAILRGIGNRVRPEVREALEECFVVLQHGSPTDPDPLAPLLSYLEDNLNVLHSSLLHVNFARFLQMFWTVICQELCSVATHFPATTTAEQRAFFSRLLDLLPTLSDYFQGNGEGITENEIHNPQFNTALDFISMFTMESKDLISKYYMHRAEEQVQKVGGEEKWGSIQVRVSFWNGRLTAEVMSAKNLVPMDQPSRIWQVFRKIVPNSDPRIELDILVRGMDEGKLESTRTEWHTLNPVFDESFSWSIDTGTCQLPSSVIRFTVRDVDVLTRNDFLGEAIVPLAKIPGIATEKPLPQPMNLRLFSTEKLDPVLAVLSTRSWDTEAQSFVSNQLSRVIQVAKRKPT